MKRHRAHRNARGFTLLEAIVTLVIVALLITVLMQALQQAMRMRQRLAEHQRATRVEALQEQWFRDSIAGAIADLPDALGVMEGRKDSLDLLTASPLDGSGLARVRWALVSVDGGQALHYSDTTKRDVVAIRGPVHEASFAYLDDQGKWLDRWEYKPGDAVVLPRAVRFQAQTDVGQWLWMVPIIAQRTPPTLMRRKELTGEP